MKRSVIVSLFAMIAVSAAGQPDPWAVLRVFEGKWEGPTSGKPGKGFSSREYRFEQNGHFLSQRNKSVYDAESPGAKPLVHEDFGVLSYDTSLKKVVWRQFHSEGFVHEYTLDSVSADGKSLDFVTVRIENIAAGWRAKESCRLLSTDEMEATFLLSAPGKAFEVYTRARLKRVK